MRSKTIKNIADRAANMNGAHIGTTDDGCFIDVGHGEQRVRLDVPFDTMIDMVASMVVSSWPAAHRAGYSIDEYLEAIAHRIGTRVDEAARTGESS